MSMLEGIKVSGKGGNFLKSGDFEGGLNVKVSRKPEIVDNTGDFGGATINGEPNKTILFHFEIEGEEYKYNTTSKRFLKGIKLCGADVGDILNISKTGEGFKTQYTIKKNIANLGYELEDQNLTPEERKIKELKERIPVEKDIKENTVPAAQEEPEEDWEKNFEESETPPRKEKEIEF